MPDTRKLVAGRYRLTTQIGTGGMGRVWLARDEVLHRDVAIKEVVLPDGLTDAELEELLGRTLREARAAGRLNHPNVIQVYDVVTFEDRPWIVMEYVPSRSLYQVIREDGPLPPRRVAEIGLLVLAALQAAHRAKVWHRDVKPGNVLLAKDGRVVLTDFGLATFDGDGGVTRSGLILGSAQYIAPERARDGASGPESDMWSLGATLYAAVEGRSPYARDSSMATLTALATAPPDTPRRAGPLRPVLLGLLRKNPRHRLRAGDTEKLLRAVVLGEKPKLPRQRDVPTTDGPIAGASPDGLVPTDLARSLVFTGATPAEPSTATQETYRYLHPPRRRWPWVTAAALVVVGLAATVVVLATHRPTSTVAAPPGTTGTTAAATDPRLGVHGCLQASANSGVPVNGPTALPNKPWLPDAPANWIYYRDPTGFALAVPEVWRVWRVGPLLCFRDPRNILAAAVYSAGSVAGTSEELVNSDEQAWKTAADLQDYHEVARVPQTYGDHDASELEYTYVADGTNLHGANLALRAQNNNVYVLCWVGAEYMWSPQLTLKASFQASFTLDN